MPEGLAWVRALSNLLPGGSLTHGRFLFRSLRRRRCSLNWNLTQIALSLWNWNGYVQYSVLKLGTRVFSIRPLR